MPSAADAALIIGEFDASIFPSGAPNLTEAALGIYQVLMYYDPPTGLLHINESNELAKPAWAQRAGLAANYLATQLGVTPATLPNYVDRMMKLVRWQGKQRHNPLGNGLRTLVADVLRRFGGQTLRYDQEVDATRIWPGITLPGRSARPKLDVLIRKATRPRAVVSCKWSIRHDRVSDPTNECTAYKSAAIQQQIPLFEYYVLTTEFSAARLEKILNQPCVDGLIHVHEPLLTTIAGPAALPVTSHPKFRDLTQFVTATQGW